MIMLIVVALLVGFVAGRATVDREEYIPNMAQATAMARLHQYERERRVRMAGYHQVILTPMSRRRAA